jgi:hypothetical protein
MAHLLIEVLAYKAAFFYFNRFPQKGKNEGGQAVNDPAKIAKGAGSALFSPTLVS